MKTNDPIVHTQDQYTLREQAQEFPMMIVLSFVYLCNARCPNCPYNNSAIRETYKDAVFMPVFGVLGGVGHLCLILALQRASASVVLNMSVSRSTSTNCGMFHAHGGPDSHSWSPVHTMAHDDEHNKDVASLRSSQSAGALPRRSTTARPERAVRCLIVGLLIAFRQNRKETPSSAPAMVRPRTSLSSPWSKSRYR